MIDKSQPLGQEPKVEAPTKGNIATIGSEGKLNSPHSPLSENTPPLSGRIVLLQP